MQWLKMVKICSMVILLSSCQSFPQLHPHLLSLKKGVCGEYKVVRQTSACDIQYEFVKWHPIEDCEGFFALPPSDISALKTYQASQCSKDLQKH